MFVLIVATIVVTSQHVCTHCSYHRGDVTACFVLVVGNVVMTSMFSGLYVVQPDYEAMEAAATDRTYGETSRCIYQACVCVSCAKKDNYCGVNKVHNPESNT